MKYRLTVLNLFAVLILLACLTRTIIDYDEMSKGEGWGLIWSFVTAGIGHGLLVLDFIIQLIFSRKK